MRLEEGRLSFTTTECVDFAFDASSGQLLSRALSPEIESADRVFAGGVDRDECAVTVYRPIYGSVDAQSRISIAADCNEFADGARGVFVMSAGRVVAMHRDVMKCPQQQNRAASDAKAPVE